MSVVANRLLRGLGWTFISVGVVVLLYLVYSLLYTNQITERDQAEIEKDWLELTEGEGDALGGGGEDDGGIPDPGTAVAALEFRRPGDDEPIVHDKPLYVVEGVSLPDLQRGPGHYPTSAMPGDDGNFAVAGHRTTYGAPFFNLDQLRLDDEVIVTDRGGKQYTYKVVEQEIVSPADTWVIAPDPLETGKRTLTLTTCNPRFSNAQRLIIFAELVT